MHFTAESRFGPYWSVTRYNDILEVDSNAAVFSSASGVAITDSGGPMALPRFIAMDPPKHDAQRKVVSPAVSPGNLMAMEPIIRARRPDGSSMTWPTGETCDWADRESNELTTQMLATLFDFPFEERRKLTRWSNLFLRGNHDEAERLDLRDWAATFQRLWDERVDAPPAGDLISMLAHGEATRDMPPDEFLGNIMLLIVGGNDTTRNSISGGLLALNRHPDQYEKLRANPLLVASMVPEIIRWQSPVAHMRRTATADYDLAGKTIRRGEKVVMWYVSGNRDETAIDNPDAFIIDRERPPLSTSPSASASTAASATAWPRCSCAGWSGKRSSSAFRSSKWWASQCGRSRAWCGMSRRPAGGGSQPLLSGHCSPRGMASGTGGLKPLATHSPWAVFQQAGEVEATFGPGCSARRSGNRSQSVSTGLGYSNVAVVRWVAHCAASLVRVVLAPGAPHPVAVAVEARVEGGRCHRAHRSRPDRHRGASA